MIYNTHQYNSLKLHQKAVILGDDAVFIMNRVEENIIYSLYGYFRFYVEVVIEEDSGKLLDIQAFNNLDALDKYLDSITLIGF